MTSALFLLRHGETLWNREGRIQGQQDSRLTGRGIAQALAMGETLRGPLAAFRRVLPVASPLGRCRQTAALVSSAAGLDYDTFRFDPLLMELAYGTWEGRRWDEIPAAEREARLADHWNHRPPGAESYADAAPRVRRFIEHHGRPLEDEAILIISHGGTGRLLRGLYLELGEQEMLALEQPQDALFRIAEGEVLRIATA